MKAESELGQRVIRAGGVLESGQLANMRTYRLAAGARSHCRIVGEGRTLCGRSLRHAEQWAWQFIHRGRFAVSRPRHVDCERCLASPVLRETP